MQGEERTMRRRQRLRLFGCAGSLCTQGGGGGAAAEPAAAAAAEAAARAEGADDGRGVRPRPGEAHYWHSRSLPQAGWMPSSVILYPLSAVGCMPVLL